jgi:hypothetical protein
MQKKVKKAFFMSRPNVHARIANSRRPIIGGELITTLEEHERRQKEWICKICNAPFSKYKHLGDPEPKYWNFCSPEKED